MRLLVRFGTLHDQLGAPRSDGALLIEDGRVAALLPAAAEPPVGATELHGRTVVPGLINAHAHLEQDTSANTVAAMTNSTPSQRAIVAAEQAGRALRSGVTTMRDLGSSANIAIDVRDAVRAGRIPGPSIVAAGRVICMTGGHGAFAGREADGPWQVRQAVRAELAAGADCIKFIATGGVLTPGAVPALAQLSEEELRAGVDEAHRHGLRCAAHAIGTQGIVHAVRAGVDSIEHGFLIDEAGIALMLAHGTRLVPTLAALRSIVDAGPGAGLPDSVLAKAREVAAHAEANLRKARAAGVRFAGGSDAGTPFNPHDGYAEELRLMREMLGMTAAEALRAATVDAADLLGVRRGTLGVGDAADLLVLDRDLDDPDAFAEPVAVLRDGQLVR